MPMHASFTPRAAHVGLWLAVVTLSACATSGRGALETGTDTESGGSVRLILHEPTGRPAPLDTCELEFCQALLERIEGAEHTIDFAVYGFRNQTVLVQALLAAQRRGVRIRGVVDRDRQGRNYYASTEEVVAALGPDTVRSDYEAELAEAEAELDRGEWDREPQCERPEGFEGPVQCLVYPIGETCLVAAHAAHCELTSEGAIMHNKFFVVDGRYLWTGSTNVSDCWRLRRCSHRRSASSARRRSSDLSPPSAWTAALSEKSRLSSCPSSSGDGSCGSPSQGCSACSKVARACSPVMTTSRLAGKSLAFISLTKSLIFSEALSRFSPARLMTLSEITFLPLRRLKLSWSLWPIFTSAMSLR